MAQNELESLIKLVVLISAKAIDCWEHYNEVSHTIEKSPISDFIDKEIEKVVKK